MCVSTGDARENAKVGACNSSFGPSIDKTGPIIRKQDDLSRRLQDCQTLLKETETYVPSHIAGRIQRILLTLLGPPWVNPWLILECWALWQDSDSGYVSNDISNEWILPVEKPQEEMEDKPASSPSSVGSLSDLDKVKYDVNSTYKTRATGLIGKSSEIAWMERLQKESEQCSRSQPGHLGPGENDKDSTTSDHFGPYKVNYHIDDLDIGVSEPVQMYWVPPRPLADKLFETYLRVAHPYHPIINRPLFCDQYKRFFDSFALPGDKWMAILNMVFAIAATYAHTAGLEWHGDHQDHLLYLTRARMLSMSGDDVFRHPDLQQVQVEGLIAFYLLSTDQIHRAWRISALAIRSAVSLGINLKSSGRTITNISKEIRNRVWWSLVAIENKLGLMTGRPTCISRRMCSSPLPLPFDENGLQEKTATSLLNDPDLRDHCVDNIMASSYLRKSPSGKASTERVIPTVHEWLHRLPVSSGLYFLYSCDLTMLMQELLDRVYAVNAVYQPWGTLKTRIHEIQVGLDMWLSSLPNSLDFTRMEVGDQGSDEKIRLAFQYYSARIMLGRPCLCRHDKFNIQKHSKEEQEFTQAMAVSTIQSAIQMALLIPDEPNGGRLAEIQPWWCLLHYVMQTTTVIILELSFNSFHMPEEKGTLLQLAKKCVRWLDRTSKHSFASHRAWQFCGSALCRLAQQMDLDVSDLSWHPYPQGQQENMDTCDLSGVNQYDAAVNDHPLQEFIVEDPAEGFNKPLAMLPSGPVDGLEVGSLPSTAAGYGRGGEGPFAHDPISEDFVDFFFHELGNKDSRE
ncbi:uncharacterized protein N7482_002003 [Penicillium canariense]|uniref:Xylanolytic transcriptional activator regulatory domain-containing protein n=1 Tax=Penicillium canariense TaxID=189055 RepID=A0A9W9IKU1_9EURO|nr:uncharacterized protein N7482_002003 [Penicillium canariense]KAJ5176126.1 hypothetical protein N7482_002003 [Penicillium canariense]